MNDVVSLPLPQGFGIAVDTQTGEAFDQVDGKTSLDHWQRVATRYLGRAAARRLLARFKLTKKSGAVFPAYRVVVCGRGVVKQDQGVSLFKALAAQRAHFGNVTQCGSVWHCPVCSAKIAARRSAEMLLATQRAVDEGGSVGLVTLTVQHSVADSCADTLERLQRLNDRVNSGKRAKAFRERFGVLGQIKAVEFTVGRNGWHPHIHALLFCDGHVDWSDVGASLRSRYLTAAVSEFGMSLPDIAVDVRGGSAAATYISGWGIHSEVAGGAWKTGKGESSAPFDLLLKVSNPDTSREARRDAALKFVDFATAVSRITGDRTTSIRQLVWSRGLKDRFGVLELTDEEIADTEEEPSVLLGNLSFSDWLRILSIKTFDARLVVLQLASIGDWSAVQSFISSLPEPETFTY